MNWKRDKFTLSLLVLPVLPLQFPLHFRSIKLLELIWKFLTQALRFVNVTPSIIVEESEGCVLASQFFMSVPFLSSKMQSCEPVKISKKIRTRFNGVAESEGQRYHSAKPHSFFSFWMKDKFLYKTRPKICPFLVLQCLLPTIEAK